MSRANLTLRIEAPLDEDDWQRDVMDLARTLGWKRAHFRPALTKHGWRTPVQGDGTGWPDLLLFKPPRILAVELKSDTGKVTATQQKWLAIFAACGIETAVWRPRDAEQVLATLRRRTPA